MTGERVDATYDYALRDHEIVDYAPYELPGTPGVQLRGPQPDLEPGQYFSCVGAAQTMGIYIERPFPELVAERIGLPALNLGVGAGWPAFFTDHHPELIEWVDRGRFLVLQVMSARGGATSWYEPTGKVEELRDRATGRVRNSVSAWAGILKHHPESAERYVEELRQSWVATTLELVRRVSVPTVLFWFSRRSTDEPVNLSLEGNLFENMGEFPQFVDRASVERVAAACRGYVECVSTRNTGHLLVSRFTGEPVLVDHRHLTGTVAPDESAAPVRDFGGLSPARNDYYPSPEMHEDAAAALTAGLARLGLT